MNKIKLTNKEKALILNADDIYLTNKSIAIRKFTSWKNNKGEFCCNDKTIYYPKTKKNLKKFKSLFGFIRFGRK